MVANPDFSGIDVQKNAANIAKLWTVLETMVHASMVVWMGTLDPTAIDIIKVGEVLILHLRPDHNHFKHSI